VIVWWLLACGGGDFTVGEQPPVAVRAWLASEPSSGGGTLMLQVAHDADVQVEVQLPETRTLELTPGDVVRTETIGDRVVETRQWRFDGGPGHHEIPPFAATWTDASGATQTAESSRLFVDIGVKPPDVGELADINEPPAKWNIPWSTAAVALGLGGVVAAGLYVAFARKEKELPPVPPESPDVVAIRAWEAVRRDPSLDDHAKALALSRIFREYAEIVLQFPCTKWTTTETLRHLEEMEHLPEGNVPRARRLLRATDRVKYADARAGTDLFEDLDADLRAFVGTTRPYDWSATPRATP
jgi:hypothetical protein